METAKNMTTPAPLMAELNPRSGATFCVSRKYRFALWRIWDDNKPKVMFIGLNPSTANEDQNDPTIRRVISMAKSWGYGGVYMMNCFPLVSTDPEKLKEFDRGTHDDADDRNWHHLKEVAKLCTDVIFAWGNFKIVREYNRDTYMAQLFPNAKALVINKNGSPKHPLYCKSDIIPVKFTATKLERGGV